MKKYKRKSKSSSILFAAAVLLLMSAIGRAEKFNTTGTTGFVFLNLPVSARFAGMGETGITLENVGADGVFINPALIARIENRNSVSLTYGSWYVDTNHQGAAYVHKFPMLGSLGVMVNFFDFGTMARTRTIAPDEVNALNPGDNNVYLNLGSYSAGALAAGISYGRYLTKDFSFGANLKYVRESIDAYYADNFLLDLGFIYNTGVGPLRVGAFLKNFGLETEYENESFKMPQRLVLGISGEILGSLQDPTYVTMLAEAVHPNDAAEHIHVGLEARLFNLLILRGGYKFGYDHENLAVGMGARFVYHARAFRFDLSYMNHKYLEHTLRYTLSMEL